MWSILSFYARNNWKFRPISCSIIPVALDTVPTLQNNDTPTVFTLDSVIGITEPKIEALRAITDLWEQEEGKSGFELQWDTAALTNFPKSEEINEEFCLNQN